MKTKFFKQSYPEYTGSDLKKPLRELLKEITGKNVTIAGSSHYLLRISGKISTTTTFIDLKKGLNRMSILKTSIKSLQEMAGPRGTKNYRLKIHNGDYLGLVYKTKLK